MSFESSRPEHAPETGAVERILAVCAQHLDVAWLWPRVPEGEDLMRQCFERALEMIEAYPDEQFVFSRSTAWSFHIVERQCPELFEKVRRRVQEGRIALCGGQWVEPDHLIPSGEALARQAVTGQLYFLETFGKTAKVCWALDNFAHGGNLPQILRKAGMDGYYLGRCLPVDEAGRPRRQFIWRGLDGSEVAAFKLSNIRGAVNAESIRGALDEIQADGLPAALVKANDAYSDRRITLDRDLPPQLRQAAANADLPECRWSSPDEIVDEMQRYRDRLAVAAGELGFEYTGTYTTDGRGKRRNRQLETLLPNAEKAACWAALHGFPYPVAQLKQAWSDLCLNQFHDLICGTSFGEVLDEADRLHTEIESRARWALDQSLDFLCDRLHAERTNGQAGADEIAVFSFVGFENTAPVLLPKRSDEPASYADESGNPVPSQEIACPDGTRADLVLHRHNGIEARIYRKRRGQGRADGPSIATERRLENELVRVELDPATGDLVSLFDKLQGSEYLPGRQRGNRLEFLEEASIGPHPAWCTMEPWWIMYTGKRLDPEATVEISLRDKGPLRGCVRVSRRMRLHPDMPETTIVQDIVLYRHSQMVHFQTRGEWHAERVMLKARFGLPFTPTRVDADSPYGVAERRLPQHLDNNASQTLGIGEEWKAGEEPPPEPDRCMHTWLDVSDGKQGLLALNNGKYGYDADEEQVGLSLMRAPNMRPWKNDILGLGPFEFSYAVMPHAGDWRAVDAPTHGQAFNNEPVARHVQPGVDDLAGCQWWDIREQAPLPIARSLLSAGERGVEVGALKRAEDGDGFVLRLAERLGEARQITLDWGQPITSIEECDLLERPTGTALCPAKGGSRQQVIELSAYEIKSLRIRFASRL